MGKGLLFWALTLFSLVLLFNGVSAYCSSNAECQELVCPEGAEQDTALCNTATGTCYCGPSSCGNKICEINENFSNCSNDCVVTCGNGECDGSENTTTCPTDCKAVCGNGLCEAGETASDCPSDCAVVAECCEWETDAYSGKVECILYCAVCGNGVCETDKGEDAFTCSFDCGTFGCGDEICNPALGEDSVSCPEDCGYQECSADRDCKGIEGCDYYKGEDYSGETAETFNVCECIEGHCAITTRITDVCGDGFCSAKESCDPAAGNFCGTDCGTCVLPDLTIKEIKTEGTNVTTNTEIELTVIVENIGSALAEPFKLNLYQETKENLIESTELGALYLTSFTIPLKSLAVYLKEKKWEWGIYLQAFDTTITASKQYGKKPLGVGFSIASTAAVERYEIDWQGDGIFDFTFAPGISELTHTFEEAGIYKVTLRATSSEGAVAIDSVNILVLDEPPTTKFSVDTTDLCGEVEYIVVVNPDGTINESNTKNNEVSILLNVICPITPTIIVEANPLQGAVPLTVTFDASKSFDLNGTIELFEFDFDDGSAAVKGKDPVVTHKKKKKGVFTVTVTATNDKGLKGSDTVTIVAGFKPKAVINVSKSKGITPLTVEFDAARSSDSDGTVEKYEWDFADGETAEGKTVSHSFTETGVFIVTLTVTDNDELQDSTTVEIATFASEKPDLVFESTLEKEVVGKNQIITLNVVVKNLDGGDAPSATIVLKDSEGVVIEEKAIAALKSLESIPISFSFNSGNRLGDSSYLLVIDPNKEISESNKRNNVQEIVVSVILIEECGNGLDDDLDGFVDEECVEICYDAIDNDLDGAVDEGCSEICGNGLDDDLDGEIDDGCDYLPEEIANNNIDDDKDGFVDEGFIEVCGNNEDDDADGQVDEGCEWVQAVFSGEDLGITFEEEVMLGQTQTIRVMHPMIGLASGVDIELVTPSGKVLYLKTDEKGEARFVLEELGEYAVSAYKYTFASKGEFKSIGLDTVVVKTTAALPLIVFGRTAATLPLLVMVFILLCLISCVLSFDRSESLFAEVIRTKGEEKRKRGIKLVVASIFFIIPITFNKIFTFEIGVSVAVIEIVVLFLLVHLQKEAVRPWGMPTA